MLSFHPFVISFRSPSPTTMGIEQFEGTLEKTKKRLRFIVLYACKNTHGLTNMYAVTHTLKCYCYCQHTHT